MKTRRKMTIRDDKQHYRKKRDALTDDRSIPMDIVPPQNQSRAADLEDLLGDGYAERPDWLVVLRTRALTLIRRTHFGQLGERIALPLVTSAKPKSKGPRRSQANKTSDDLAARLKEHLIRIAGPNVDTLSVGSTPIEISLEALDEILPPEADREFMRNILRKKSDEKTEEAIALMCVFAPFWIRPAREWSGTVTSRTDWIPSLLEHLFVRYPIPRFLYSNWTWTERDTRWQASIDHKYYRDSEGLLQVRPKWIYWLILLGQGGSLERTEKTFCWSIPPRFVHCLFDVPEHLPGREACMWAEVLRLGGTAYEAQRLMKGRLVSFLLDVTEPLGYTRFVTFWHNTVRWLARYQKEIAAWELAVQNNGPMRTLFAKSPYDPLLTWVLHMKSEGFSWRGRKPARVFEAVHNYHRSMFEPALNVSWQGHGWDWEFRESDASVWTVREMTTGQELSEESQALHHCAVSYAEKCAAKRTAMFSLRWNGKRMLTVELRPDSGYLLQTAGVCNRSATPAEDAIVRRWLAMVVQKSIQEHNTSEHSSDEFLLKDLLTT